MICREVINVLEDLSPKEYALEWDNVGLLIGREYKKISKIMIALDANDEVVDYAILGKADMLITHHPLIFSPLKKITEDSITGRRVLALAEAGVAYYAMHTNFDIKGGMAQLSADMLGLVDQEVLEICRENNDSIEGIGRVGSFEKNVTVTEIVEKVKKIFGLNNVIFYGDLEKNVYKVAISPGSGKGVIAASVMKKCDLLITGDIGHHEGLDAVAEGVAIIDATHYGLEHIFMNYIKKYLETKLEEQIDIEVIDIGSPVRFL